MKPPETRNEMCSRKLRESPPQRILIRARECLGDLVNTSGAVLTLRKAFPESTIVLEVGERAEPAAMLLRGFDDLWVRRRNCGFTGKLATIRQLRGGRFDAVFVFEESRKLIVEAKLAGIPLRVGLHKGYGTRFYSGMIEHRRDVHEARDNFRILLESVGLEEFVQPPRLEVEPYLESAKILLTQAGIDFSRPVVGIHCAGPNARRGWPAESIREVSLMLFEVGIQCLFLGSKEDRHFFATHHPKALDSGLDMVGKLTFPQAAAGLSLCDICIVPDSCVMHIGAILGVSVVALYQECNDPVYTGPDGEGHVILKSEELCLLCPIRVIEAIEQMLKSMLLSSAPQLK